jgi:hypothetical protein
MAKRVTVGWRGRRAAVWTAGIFAFSTCVHGDYLPSVLRTAAAGELAPRQPPFLVPDYDVRLALRRSVISDSLFGIYPTSYGDLIRLGEIKCGDQAFAAGLDFPPAFHVGGRLDTGVGQSFANLTLYLGATAKLGTGCVGLEGVSLFADVSTELGRVSEMNQLRLRGDAKVRPLVALGTAGDLLEILQVRVPIDAAIDSPIKSLGHLPVTLSSTAENQLDFGTFCAFCPGSWASDGPSKEIPLVVNVGAPTLDPPHSDYLTVDVTFGKTAYTRTVASEMDAHRAFFSDIPIWNDTGQQRNVGVSVRDSALSKVAVCGIGGSAFEPPKPCDVGRGLFRELLPIRVRGVTHINERLDLEYAVILTEAGVTPTTVNGKPARRISLTAGYTGLRLVRQPSGTPLGKPWSPVQSATAALVMQDLDVKDGKFVFNVADFRISFKTDLLFPPNDITTPDLSPLVNGGAIPLPVDASPSYIEIPDCLGLDPKFKAADFRCGSPGKAIGALSRNGHPGFRVQLKPSSFAIRDTPWLMVSALLEISKREDLPVGVLKVLTAGTPVLATRWVSTKPGEYQEAQCGTVGGVQFAPLGERSAPIRMDTDGRPDHCELQWSIIDPKGALAGLIINVGWTASGDPGQCKGVASRPIKLTNRIPASTADIEFSNVIGIDTDDRSGGCYMSFALSGRTDVLLDLWFWGDDDPSQCEPWAPPSGGPMIVDVGQPATLLIDTDRRYGGCVFQTQLRRR